jgi:hypothetical protein
MLKKFHSINFSFAFMFRIAYNLINNTLKQERVSGFGVAGSYQRAKQNIYIR